jgi:hypothetical protein
MQYNNDDTKAQCLVIKIYYQAIFEYVNYGQNIFVIMFFAYSYSQPSKTILIRKEHRLLMQLHT